jgi:predicted HicB family RNase H-like nuclease
MTQLGMDKAKKPRGRPPIEQPATEYLQVRLTPEDKGRYSRAAQKAGDTLSAWVKRVLDRASRR